MKNVLTIQIAAPIGGKRTSLTVKRRMTLAAIVKLACKKGLLDADEIGRLRTYVNQLEVHPDKRAAMVPVPGDYVLLYPTPQFETIAMAITEIVAALSPGAITATITSALGIHSLAGALAIYGLTALTEATVAAAAIGTLSRLISGRESTKSTYGISGAGNKANPDGICPVLLGKRRVVPQLAASYWTETVDDDVYLRGLFQWSVAPVQLSDLKIGETPIDKFDEVEIQHRLLPTDAFPTLYNKVVREDTYGSLQLVHDNGWVQRRTQKDTTKISIDFAFPNGLAWNGKNDATVKLHVQYRAVDSSTWIDAPFSSDGTVTYKMTKPKAFRRNVAWTVSEGEYDVQVYRVTGDAGDDYPRLQDQVYWVCMRSFGEGLPVIGDNFALTALRIKATNQLNGQIADFNGIAEALIPTWDDEQGDFVGRSASSNPGDQLAWIATGAANAKPLTGRIDLASFGTFAETCTAKGWKCDTIIDSEMSVEQALALVSSAGHALGMPWIEGKLTVSIDDERSAPVQVFSARNVANFSGAITYPDALHAVDVTFYDASSDYQKEVRTVYADGYDVSTATSIEAIHTDVKTDAAEAYVFGWDYIYTRTHRPETYSWDCNRTGMVAPWGSRVDVAHPRMLVGICGTRIKQVITRESDGYVTALVIDEMVPMEADTSYVLKPQRGTSIGLLEIVTEAGTTNTLTLATPVAASQAPVTGNHCVFGVGDKETIPVLIVGVAQKADQTSHLTCIPYAPELQAHGGTIEAWNPKITSRAMAESVATGKVTETVRKSVDEETVVQLAHQQAATTTDVENLTDDVDDVVDKMLADIPSADDASALSELESLASKSDLEALYELAAASALQAGALASDYYKQVVDKIAVLSGTASAAIETVRTVAVSATEAVADLAETVEANYDAVTASVTSEAQTRSTADVALGTRIDNVISAYQSADATATAAISSEAQTRASADSALSTRLSTIEADYTTSTGLSSALASYVTYAYASSSLVSVTGLSTTLANYLTTSSAASTYLTTAAAASTYATSTALSSVSSTLANLNASGYLRITAQSYTEGSSALVGLAAVASSGATSSTAALLLYAASDGTSWAAVRAGSFYVQKSDGTNTAVFDSSGALNALAINTPIINGVKVSSSVLTYHPNIFAQNNVTSNGWLSSSTPTSYYGYNGICWAAKLGLFCAVGSTATTNTPSIITSANAVSWTSRTPASTYRILNDVCWSEYLGLFCAVGDGGAIQTSPDGDTWTARTSSISSADLEGVCWSPDLKLFCAVAYTGIITSPDGETWTTRVTTNSQRHAVTWSPELGLFCVVGGSKIHVSSDGKTWTTKTNSHALYDVCWSPELGLFCAVGDSGAIQTSPDGDTWTTRTPAVSSALRSVCWAAEIGLFCVIVWNTSQSSGVYFVMTSPDGDAWTSGTTTTSKPWEAVCWSGDLGLFVAVSSDGTSSDVMTSKSAWAVTYRSS